MSPAPARRPPGASSPPAPPHPLLRVFTRSRAGARRLRAGPTPRLCLPPGAGEGGSGGVFRERGGRGPTTRTRGRTDGCRSPWRPETGPEIGGHPATCGPISPAGANRGAPCPHHHGTTLDSRGSAPWTSHSPWKAPLPAGALDWGRRGASGWRRRWGGPASPRRGERLITSGLPGMPGPWRPLPSLGTSRASSPLPSGTSLPATARGDTAASGLRSGPWIPGRRHGGSPQRPGRRACLADGNSEGGKVREKGSLSSLRVNNTCPTPGDAFSSRASLTTERGGRAKGTEHDASRAGEHIVVPRRVSAGSTSCTARSPANSKRAASASLAP